MEQRLIELTKENSSLKNRLDLQQQQQITKTTNDSVIVAGPSSSSVIHPKPIQYNELNNNNNDNQNLIKSIEKTIIENSEKIKYQENLLMNSAHLLAAAKRSAFSIPNFTATKFFGNKFCFYLIIKKWDHLKLYFVICSNQTTNLTLKKTISFNF